MKRLILTFLAVIASSPLAYGQAKLTATRTGDFQVGGGFVADYPDYTEHKFFGYAIYADLDFGEHFGIEGEFRKAHDTTPTIGGGGNVPQFQRDIEGGLRYHRSYRSETLKPYVKAMYGYGVMQYPPYAPPASQTTANGSAGYQFIAPGGGLDYVISPHIVLRGDLEYQMWFSRSDPGLGYDVNAGGKGGLPNGLTPIVYTGGIAWRFGTGQYIPHGDRRKGMY